jgi:hypothetical protein
VKDFTVFEANLIAKGKAKYFKFFKKEESA